MFESLCIKNFMYEKKVKLIVLYNLQFTRTVPMLTTQVKKLVACTLLILMVWVHLKSSVIRIQPVEDGRCFRRDLTAL